MKSLHKVTVSLSMDIYVMAEGSDGAEKVARRAIPAEVENVAYGDWDTNYRGEVLGVSAVEWEWLDSVPHGCDDGKTISEILEGKE